LYQEHWVDLAGASGMDIVSYRDLESEEDIFMLWLKSFGWPGTAAWLENFKKYETRISDGPVGMCGLIKGKIAGFVGIMSIPTRTRHGDIENVGGIHDVSVHPSYARRGTGRKLLEAAEEYLRGQGTRLVFLTTSRSIVAYQWYCDVGYRVIDIVDDYPHMYKIFSPPQTLRKKDIPQKKHKLDLKHVQKLWDWYGGRHCGFTIRNLKDLKSREMMDDFSKKLSISVKSGYALLRSRCDTIQYVEILARSQKAYRELIKLADSRAKYAAVAIQPFDRKAREAFEKARYRFDSGQYGVLMCKQLAGTTFDDLYDNRFVLSRLDWF
jgi:ribosomal protein S18 acetylase RimI-like enzyme